MPFRFDRRLTGLAVTLAVLVALSACGGKKRPPVLATTPGGEAAPADENDVFSEEVRIDNASWGIGLDVLPLTDNVVYSWFEMKVTNVYNNQTETYGYGRTNGFELKRLIPMYNTGLYKFEFTGNRVKVDVTVAKRNP